ncbi:RICIN domain-containing protein [Hymenobacter sp. 5317J-9]|uniref:RICIN domain-containing protein n=1 Tax=Hymenobacter sp. 5317J-9 TaxID=2932250 RepID=UPI001FD69352|nr:RICIN domain-containing protein [Hymenobacter sp. 5317J-9]UOQ97009.1 RICIN domain-containing protein [Hymenobacter sp. 5317J-9]
MKKQATLSLISLLARPRAARWGLVLLLGLARFVASAQAISPQFFGINYWNIKSGSTALTDPLANIAPDLRKADLKWMRIGGNRFDTDPLWENAANYASAINYARSVGATPLVQIPIHLTATELGAFVADCANRGYNITYWAIGNEPDPSGTTLTWVSGSSTYLGYTYATWAAHYRELAAKLKTVAPNAKLVGPDFRLFYNVANPGDTAGLPSYYQTFLDDLGDAYLAGTTIPLLDHFAFHFYADRTESVVSSRFATLRTMLNTINNGPRKNNGPAAPITLAVTEVNVNNAADNEANAWEFKAGQFVALMAKNAMQQSALCFTPWSIYESGAGQTEFDYSLYATMGSTGSPARRSTMWHLAMLSNNRQANVMNGTQSTEQNNLVFIGMRGPDGYTLLIMNMQASTSYTYRASFDGTYHAGSEAVKLSLEAYTPLSRELVGSIPARTTHLYRLDASGNVLEKLYYTDGDAAPRHQLSFNLVSRSSIAAGTAGYARPTGGAATADVTQFVGDASALSSTRWVLQPADPGYYYVLNQSTNLALRPKGATDAERLQENQPISQEALSTSGTNGDYMMWKVVYTGSGGYYRFQNKRSGKYLNVKGGGVTADLPLVQYTDQPTYLSEQWRFDAAAADNEAVQARPAVAGLASGPAPAAGLSTFPNPATGTLYLALDADAGQAILRDLTGRVCLSRAVGRNGQLDLQGLASGMYHLTVTTATGQLQQKIVKE